MSFFEFPHTRTYDSDLGWIVSNIRIIIDCCEEMHEWRKSHEQEYKQLKQLYDDINKGIFPESIIDAFNSWMHKNAISIVGEMVKSVFFEISDSGYFIANIPESWSDIIFNTTGLDIEIAMQPDYGHLVLSY